MNRLSLEKKIIGNDSSRNQRLEKHYNIKSKPLYHSSSRFNQSSVIGNSLSYTNDGKRKINYISPQNDNLDDKNQRYEKKPNFTPLEGTSVDKY